MKEQTKDEVRAAVREQYGSIARSTTGASCAPGCCGPRRQTRASSSATPPRTSPRFPRARTWASAAATRRRSPRSTPGETVLDLGAGGGFDCFLAAKQVGPTGASSAST